MPTIGSHWRGIAKQFLKVGIDCPDLDARLLTAAALDYDDGQMIVHEHDVINDAAVARLTQFVQRRQTGEPVARILGVKEFYGLAFELNAQTLVPRPETELLVDLGLEHLKDRINPCCLDLGTGTGCVPISLLVHHTELRAVGVDLAGEALVQAQLNSVQHDVGQRLELVQGSWFEPVDAHRQFDLITANPPYIVRDVCEELAAEVRLFDPRLALDGGEDGLDAYREILQSVGGHLVSDGMLLLEIGFDQSDAVSALCKAAGFRFVSVRNDLAGHNRVIVASR